MQIIILGIAASITASYVSGIYYAFFCSPDWRNFYLVTVGRVMPFCVQIVTIEYSVC